MTHALPGETTGVTVWKLNGRSTAVTTWRRSESLPSAPGATTQPPQGRNDVRAPTVNAAPTHTTANKTTTDDANSCGHARNTTESPGEVQGQITPAGIASEAVSTKRDDQPEESPTVVASSGPSHQDLQATPGSRATAQRGTAALPGADRHTHRVRY